MYIPFQTKGQNFSVIRAMSKEGILGIPIFQRIVKGKEFSCFLMSLF